MPHRTALVMGNASYEEGRLNNPLHDAQDMRDRLMQLGFEVIYEEDASLDQMFNAVTRFGELLQTRQGVGLVYYAGHGAQVKGQNYLIPLSSSIEHEDEVPFKSLPLNAILAKLERADNRLNLVYLDACRNNPFARRYRSTNQGLASLGEYAPAGTKIYYATRPNEQAKDGTERNGIFTGNLLFALQQPNLDHSEVFSLTATLVMRETFDQQIPWEEGLVLGKFIFNPIETIGLPEQAETEPVAQTLSPSSQSIQMQLNQLFIEAKEQLGHPLALAVYVVGFLSVFALISWTILQLTKIGAGGRYPKMPDMIGREATVLTLIPSHGRGRIRVDGLQMRVEAETESEQNLVPGVRVVVQQQHDSGCVVVGLVEN